MLVYAASSDLQSWTGTAPPANATQLLRTASMLVRKTTMTATYAVDDTGLPTDADTLQAFKDATCAHAAAMDAARVDPLAGGLVKATQATSKKVGSASVEYAGAAAAAAARARLAEQLAPEAVTILQQAGLIPATPWVAG